MQKPMHVKTKGRGALRRYGTGRWSAPLMAFFLAWPASLTAQSHASSIKLSSLLRDSGLKDASLQTAFALDIPDTAAWGNHVARGGLDPAHVAVKFASSEPLPRELSLSFAGKAIKGGLCGPSKLADDARRDPCRPVDVAPIHGGFRVSDGGEELAILTIYADQLCVSDRKDCGLRVPVWGINPRNREIRNFPERVFLLQSAEGIHVFDPLSSSLLFTFHGFNPEAFGLVERVSYLGNGRFSLSSFQQILYVDFSSGTGIVFPTGLPFVNMLQSLSDLRPAEREGVPLDFLQVGMTQFDLVSRKEVMSLTENTRQVAGIPLELPDSESIIGFSADAENTYLLLQSASKAKLIKVKGVGADTASRLAMVRAVSLLPGGSYRLSGQDIYVLIQGELRIIDSATNLPAATSVTDAVNAMSINNSSFVVQDAAGKWSVYRKHDSNPAAMKRVFDIPSTRVPFIGDGPGYLTVGWIAGGEMVIQHIDVVPEID